MGFGRGCPGGWLSWIFGLARVTEMSFLRRGEWVRFIPAGAGNTLRSFQQWSAPAVYPRWRGEHCATLTSAAAVIGLSPLARGTHVMVQGVAAWERFIPAGAGNTSPPPTRRAETAVYPRWRGEHNFFSLIRRLAFGLSPLARGTRFGLR